MRSQKVRSKEFQFYFPDLDNIVLVNCHTDGTVTVRVTKGNFTEERKLTFIRRLAAEGFIPDEYQQFSGSVDESNGIRWIKDLSWLKISPAVTHRCNRFMGKLLLAAVLILIAMIRVLLVSHPTAAAGKTVPRAVPSAVIANSLSAETSDETHLSERR